MKCDSCVCCSIACLPSRGIIVASQVTEIRIVTASDTAWVTCLETFEHGLVTKLSSLSVVSLYCVCLSRVSPPCLSIVTLSLSLSLWCVSVSYHSIVFLYRLFLSCVSLLSLSIMSLYRVSIVSLSCVSQYRMFLSSLSIVSLHRVSLLPPAAGGPFLRFLPPSHFNETTLALPRPQHQACVVLTICCVISRASACIRNLPLSCKKKILTSSRSSL